MNRMHFTATIVLAAAIGCTQTNDAQSGTETPVTTAAQPEATAEPTAAKTVQARSAPLPIGAEVVMGETEMKNVDGTMVSIAGSKGDKGTLVIFTCNHCPYVKAWEPRIARLGNEARSMGFGVIAINSNDPAAYAEDGFDEMKTRAAQLGLGFPYVVDATSDVARAFGASKTPEVFLFDASDKLVYYGAIDDNYQDADNVEQHYLRDALKSVSTGKPVSKTVTKALGCSIKLRTRA